METRKSNVLVVLLIACYVISVTLSFARIYVFHAYPIYYSEDEMPGLLDLFTDMSSLWNR